MRQLYTFWPIRQTVSGESDSKQIGQKTTDQSEERPLVSQSGIQDYRCQISSSLVSLCEAFDSTSRRSYGTAVRYLWLPLLGFMATSLPPSPDSKSRINPSATAIECHPWRMSVIFKSRLWFLMPVLESSCLMSVACPMAGFKPMSCNVGYDTFRELGLNGRHMD